MALGITVKHWNNRLACIFHNELGREVQSDLTPLLVLGGDLNRFIGPILESMDLKRPATIRGAIGKLRSLGEALSHLCVFELPRTEPGWQALVIEIHRFILLRTDRKSTLSSRCSNDWLTIRGFLISLVEAGIIPISTYIPPVRDTLESVNITPYQDRLLGQVPAEKVCTGSSVDKLLCSISIARTDAEYLEEIRDTLTSRRQLLKEVLTKYWLNIKSNIDFGKKLIASVNWDELEPLVEGHPKGEPKSHPAYPLRNLEGLANYLAVIRHKYDGIPWSDSEFNKHPEINRFIPKQVTFGSIEAVARKLGAPDAPYGSDGWFDRHVLWWWLGRISHHDVAAISALLILLHPSWTPTALAFATVADRNGKMYLDFGDGGFSFEIPKHRAKEMKHEILDPLALEIISTLIHESASIRRELLNANDPKSTLLFLPYGKRKIVAPIPSATSAFLSGSNSTRGKSRVWLGSMYPELIDGGLTKGTINLKKIRNTEGVLEWFRTKSLRAVARKLGNTEKVVLQHYIPKALLDAWNTRMIRRFQNLWLSVAAANEEFLLDVTDFSSLADLHAFLKDLLQMHKASDSPLAELMHSHFGDHSNSDQKFSFSGGDANLHVAISKGTLAALYSYQATVLDLGLSKHDLDKSDVVTGISPRQFIALADLLQSHLENDKNPEYVAAHTFAMQYAMNPENKGKWAALHK